MYKHAPRRLITYRAKLPLPRVGARGDRQAVHETRRGRGVTPQVDPNAVNDGVVVRHLGKRQAVVVEPVQVRQKVATVVGPHTRAGGRLGPGRGVVEQTGPGAPPTRACHFCKGAGWRVEVNNRSIVPQTQQQLPTMHASLPYAETEAHGQLPLVPVVSLILFVTQS